MTSATERASLLLEGAARRKESIVSPEGVPMSVEVASYGDRLAAFILDSLFWTVAAVVLFLAILMSSGMALGLRAGLSLGVFAAFLLRNLYMIHFELVWRGATPGKRLMGIKVIDRHGGPLLPGAIIARNLTREIEYFLPVGLLSAGAARGAPWLALCLGLWFLLFTLLPLFNRQRLRAGDLIAGTMVVVLPRRLLLDDLAEHQARFVFAERQLRSYGAFELQVLEELLRRAAGKDAARLRREVADKICRKIAWTEPVGDTEVEQFLRDFYAAERAFLEREQLYGRPKASKEDVGKPASGG
ncbi:MAG: RDD family protein [Dongiales bacterium]